MGSDVAEAKKEPKGSCTGKVHDTICCELVKISEKITSILPAIESARPGSSSGIQVLCALNNTVEKMKLLVHYCAESSKLYLAITAESIRTRCERIRMQLNQSLCQIQTMVPLSLASKIGEVLSSIRDVKFIVNPREDEAGKALLNLLAQTESTEEQEFEAFQDVASSLNITSPIALLIERRSLKKLLDKFNSVDYKKEKILKYFLYLLKKCGKQLLSDTGEFLENADEQGKHSKIRMNSKSHACKIEGPDQPLLDNIELPTELPNREKPSEFCCPISSELMYDPVVIASGQTYERFWIEKWFNEGHDTCPKTQKKLDNLSMIPNSCMKDLIINWCKKHGVSIVDPCTQLEEAGYCSKQTLCSNSVSSLKNVSTASLDGSDKHGILENEHDNMSLVPSAACGCLDSSPLEAIELFSWSDDCKRYQWLSNFNKEMYLKFLFELSILPKLLQEKAVDDIINLLENDEATFCAMLSNGFEETLMLFLKKACNLCDAKAQRIGAQIFVALILNKRWKIASLNACAFQLLSSLIKSGFVKEALTILQKLVHHPECISYILASGIPSEVLQFLNSEDSEYVEIAVKILLKLSSHLEIRSHILSSGSIQKLGQLLSDRRLVRHCLNILQNLIDDEEILVLIVDARGCISSVAEILESGNDEEKEQAVTILLSICSRSLRNCLMVLKEGVIPSLVDISVNGNSKGRENSTKLLHVLRDIRHSDCLDSLQPRSEPKPKDKPNLVQQPADNTLKILPNKSFRLFGRKKKHISKSGVLL